MTLIQMTKPIDEELLYRVQDFLNMTSTVNYPIRLISATIGRIPPDREDSKLSKKDFNDLGHAYLYFRSIYPVGHYILWLQDSSDQVIALSTRRWELAFQALMDSKARHVSV
jgi:hypothetical protein